MNKYILKLTDHSREYQWKIEINLSPRGKKTCFSCQNFELDNKKKEIYSSIKRIESNWDDELLNRTWYHCQKHTKTEIFNFENSLEKSGIILLNLQALEEIRKELKD